MMKKVKVELGENTYPIFIGKNLFLNINNFLEEKKLFSNRFLIIDNNVYKNFGKNIINELQINSTKFEYFVFDSKEIYKSFSSMQKIYTQLLEKKFGRDTLIISIGGGVLGDLTGFAASTFMRGIPYIQIPTTLLACVDSAIGGKTGINFYKRKNIIGSFYQPKFVLIDTNFLKTLPRNEIVCGVGEIIKYAFLSDNNFYKNLLTKFDSIFELENQFLEQIIYESCKIKAAVVSQDEKETGIRKILNFGHTFAHSIESELNFKIKHGEAVIAGIISALYLSNLLGFISSEKLNEFLQLPLKIKLPSKISSLDKNKLYEIMLSDKKNRENKIKFVLLQDIGKILIDVEATKKEVNTALDKMFEKI